MLSTIVSFLQEESSQSSASLPIGMMMLFVALNFAISWFNAKQTGLSWADSKAVGGWIRFVVWCSGVMAAAGFSWCFVVILALLAHAFNWLPHEYVIGTIELGYLVLILPIIGSGLGLTAHSYAAFARERSFRNGAVAAWNTYAQVHNTMSAIRSIPPVLEDLSGLFKGGGDGKGKAVLLMIVLVILAVVGGVMLTIHIVRANASEYSSKISSRMSREYEKLTGEPVPVASSAYSRSRRTSRRR